MTGGGHDLPGLNWGGLAVQNTSSVPGGLSWSLFIVHIVIRDASLGVQCQLMEK